MMNDGLIFMLLFLLHVKFSSVGCSLLRSEKGDYYLLLEEQGNLVRPIPNKETAMELGDIKSAISFRLGNSTPSLKMEVENPDEKTRVEMEKILVVAPPDFWVDTHIIRGIRNPSLVFWMNKTLILWPVINYGANTCFIQFCWLNENFTIDARAENFGIDANTRIKTLSFNRIDEDPRLLLLKNGSIFVTTSVKINSLRDHPRESYLVIHFNASSQRAEFQDSALLHSPSINAIGKNWIPFEYNQSIYLIVSINPSHIVELLPGRDRNETEKGLLRNVVYNESEKNLPWLVSHFSFAFTESFMARINCFTHSFQCMIQMCS